MLNVVYRISFEGMMPIDLPGAWSFRPSNQNKHHIKRYLLYDSNPKIPLIDAYLDYVMLVWEHVTYSDLQER